MRSRSCSLACILQLTFQPLSQALFLWEPRLRDRESHPRNAQVGPLRETGVVSSLFSTTGRQPCWFRNSIFSELNRGFSQGQLTFPQLSRMGYPSIQLPSKTGRRPKCFYPVHLLLQVRNPRPRGREVPQRAANPQQFWEISSPWPYLSAK